MSERTNMQESFPNSRDLDLSRFSSEFARFGEIYRREIQPGLQAREVDRIAARKSARQWLIGGIGGGLAVAGGGLMLTQSPLFAILGFVLGAGAAGYGQIPLQKLKGEAKDLIVEPIAREMGVRFDPRPMPPPEMPVFRDLNLVPRWDRENYEDRIDGERGGVPYQFFEAKLEQRRTRTDSRGRTRTTWVTVFRGQCLSLKFHKRFLGRTLVTRDAGWFNSFGGGGEMKRARLEDPVFEKAFEVYTTDQVEARFLLTPDFMERLVELEKAFHGGKLRCAFDQGRMYIALEGGNLFEPGGLSMPLDTPSRIEDVLYDFSSLFDLIDAVGERDRMDRPRS